MMETSYFPPNYLTKMVDGKNLDIVQSNGLPKCGN